MSLPKRRRGAPLGNQNASKHGFYSRHSSFGELPLHESGEDLDQQIAAIRLYMQRVAELGEDSQDLPLLVSLLRGMCLASSRLDHLLRRQAMLSAPKISKEEIQHLLQSLMSSLEPGK